MSDWQIAMAVMGANVMVWIAMRADKKAAIAQGRRVPEKTLLTLALIGGTPGMLLAMQAFRHKTSKLSFKLQLLGVMIVQSIAIVMMVFK